eukprot:302600-Pyramimonas_sp.AAC.1
MKNRNRPMDGIRATMVRVTGIARRLTARPRPDVAVSLACPFAGEMRATALAGKRSRRAARAATHSPTPC